MTGMELKPWTAVTAALPSGWESDYFWTNRDGGRFVASVCHPDGDFLSKDPRYGIASLSAEDATLEGAFALLLPIVLERIAR